MCTIFSKNLSFRGTLVDPSNDLANVEIRGALRSDKFQIQYGN